MTRILSTLRQTLRAFRTDESGVVTVQFVIIFPVFFAFFLMTYENGIISVRHVMLERGIDIAVRDVRIGSITDPTQNSIRKRICEVSMIIPDCENQMQVEMVRRDPRSWADLDSNIQCTDRSVASQPVTNFTNGKNNELVLVRACVRIDPMMPTTGIGKAIVESNSGASAGGSYALIATAAFVVEPFNDEE